MELPFDRLLKICAKDLVDEAVWTSLDEYEHNGEQVHVSFKQVRDMQMLRFKSLSDSVLDEGFQLGSVPRPEVFYNEEILKKHGMSDPGCVYHLEQVLAPGDVIVSG